MRRFKNILVGIDFPYEGGEVSAELLPPTPEALAAPIRKTGIDVDTEALLGKTSIKIKREIMRGEHDPRLRVAKGKDSCHRGFYGKPALR